MLYAQKDNPILYIVSDGNLIGKIENIDKFAEIYDYGDLNLNIHTKINDFALEDMLLDKNLVKSFDIYTKTNFLKEEEGQVIIWHHYPDASLVMLQRTNDSSKFPFFEFHKRFAADHREQILQENLPECLKNL